MPQKYQPDYIFLRQVKTRRVHLFTSIQLICFAMLWIIKSYKPTSIAFPLMVFFFHWFDHVPLWRIVQDTNIILNVYSQLVIMILLRKCLEYVFSREELKALDDIMPESTKRKLKEEKEKIKKKKKELTETKFKEQLRIERMRKQSINSDVHLVETPMIRIEAQNPTQAQSDQQINISEQLGLSSAWKNINQINYYNRFVLIYSLLCAYNWGIFLIHSKRINSKNEAQTEDEKTNLNTSDDSMGPEKDCGITIRINWVFY